MFMSFFPLSNHVSEHVDLLLLSQNQFASSPFHVVLVFVLH